jgi:hypothetical protein
MDETRSPGTVALAGIVVQDEHGDYYAIARADLSRFRVADGDRPVVEAFLQGDDVGGFALPLAALADDQEGDDATGGSASPGTPPRTSRRADTLWLISR